MNLRTTTIQLFLMAATATSHASAFVAPSAKTTIERFVSGKPYSTAFVSPAYSRTSLSLSSKVEQEARPAHSAEALENIKFLEEAIELLESIDKPDSAFLTEESLVEGAVSRMSVTMENDAHEDFDDLDASEAVKSESTNSFLSFGIKLLKTLLLGEEYVVDGKMSYATYPPHPEFLDVDLSWMMKMMKGPPPPEYLFSLHKIKRIIKRFLRQEAGFLATAKDVSRASAEEAFEEFFTDIVPLSPKPRRLIKHWEEDKEFARQFLAGVNPVMINVAKDLFQLSSNVASHFGEDKLQGLINEKRLFFVSYDELLDLPVNPHQGEPLPLPGKDDDLRPFYAPIIVFELDEDRKELDIMGIQLERTDDAKIYTKNDANDEWLFAKMHVATSDSNIHEWVSHLGQTHLTMEPHIIAIHNTLKLNDHKLATFFAPLVKDTLFLNYVARKTLALFGPEAFGDRQSSIGVGQFMQINKKWWSTYDFFESSGLPSELESRGFDKDFDMPSYFFREDGLRLWDSYGKFAANFVDEIYISDEEVAKDEVVQEWAMETTAFDKGAVPGFPSSIKDKKTLVKIMQTLMWVPSGLHAAVNFPQFDYYAYIPNKPMFLRESIPAVTSREDIFKDACPTTDSTKELLTVLNVLTLPSETCIDNLEACFPDIGYEAYKEFQSELEVISNDIEKRNFMNKIKRRATYSYLNPSVVPASIDI